MPFILRSRKSSTDEAKNGAETSMRASLIAKFAAATRTDSGAVSIEYALIASLVVLPIIVGLTGIGNQLSPMYSRLVGVYK